jgi:hypothetical protein
MRCIKLSKIGSKHITKEGCEIEVIEKVSNKKVKIKFLDEYGYMTVVNIGETSIKNPFHKSVFGMGYFGVGNYKAKSNHKHFYYYRVWQSMFDRCYSGKDKIYTNVTVCEEWHNYQNFAKWFHETFPSHIKDIKFHLDKDLLQQGIENKIYSPQTCVWLPRRVNSFLQVKNKNTKTGITGIQLLPTNKYLASSTLFRNQGKTYRIGTYITIEEAIEAYKEFKLTQEEEVRKYLKILNYLPDNIINLIDSKNSKAGA